MQANKFDGSTVAITGGTGSFGSTMVSEILRENPVEVRIFSRDENKQDAMRRKFSDERLKFYIGDVRNEESVARVIKDTNFIFHAAALKQVPSCDFFPMEAVQTNVIGSSNVIKHALQNQVESIVCLSTDKAVYPINAMGMTKALMEKVALSEARNNQSSRTRITVTRYGNVMMSRGSVIPLFIEQILSDQVLTITNPKMTRFLMSLDDSVALVKHAFLNGSTGDLFVQKSPASTVLDLALAIAKILGKESTFKYQTIGTRHGEKLYESLLSSEDSSRAANEGRYFRVPLDMRSLDYSKFFDQGNDLLEPSESYTSHNTDQLNVDDVVQLLKSDRNFQNLVEEMTR
ncbi:polysaccharide biosynthesis protein [Candidatus Planktophila dulcis]|uniref:polysaccharide biosynthesis protein n=1 Tax=Candidatus Planktophila dulcis TaxID=1884914 RepID=UPI003CF1484D